MKLRLKNLLGVLGVALCTTAVTGCRADAEDAAAQPENSKPQAVDSASVTSAATITNTPATLVQAGGNAASTAEPNSAGATNQEVTVVKTIPPSAPENLKLSKAVQDIVHLAQSGVGDNVIQLYVEKATEPFNLDAADIIYLNDIGISSNVIAAMLNHDGASPELQKQLTNNIANAELAAAPTPPANTPTPQSAPLPAQPGPVQYSVSSNYTANGPQVVVIPDPNAPPAQQPPVIVQQPPLMQEPVVVSDPAEDYSYFYSSLAPYGSWAYVTDYGWCWQPTIAVAHTGWRPYAHGGHWLYSDCGWYWHSDYSWGWAPFHYGRWYCAPRIGWVWTPDYTWGPSWVTWRRSGDYCGWAPLPPRCYVRPGVGFTYWDHNVGFSFNFGLTHDHFTFVPTSHFVDRHPMQHVIPTERAAGLYRNSTVINNYSVNNNTIVNNGLSRDYVTSHTHTEIPRVAVREETYAPGRAVAPDRIQRSGSGELVVYRPTPPPARAEAALRAKQEAIRPAGAVSGSAGLAAVRPNNSAAIQARTAENIQRPVTSSPSTAAPRVEVARPQIVHNPAPAFGTPAPLRPEAAPQPVSRPARTEAQASASASVTHPANPGHLSTTGSGRTETFAANNQAQNGVPLYRSQAQVDNGSVRQPVNTPSRAEVIHNVNPGTFQQQTLSQNPVARPTQSAPVPRYAPQPEASAAPQPIRPSVPYTIYNNSSANLPQGTIVNRNENFGAARPVDIPPERSQQVIVPSQQIPIQRPIQSAPIPAEAPRVYVPPVQSSGGGQVQHSAAASPPQQVHSAPAQAAPRPVQQQQQSAGRGRLEIGR
jgi:hypothetical protein